MKEIFHQQLLNVCDNIWKLKYVNGEITLKQYLVKEKQHLKKGRIINS